MTTNLSDMTWTSPTNGWGPVERDTATKTVNVNLVGVNQLRLVVTNGTGTKTSDHADWADATVTC